MDVLAGGLVVTAGVLLPLGSYKTASRGAGAEGAASARKTLRLHNIHNGARGLVPPGVGYCWERRLGFVHILGVRNSCLRQNSTESQTPCLRGSVLFPWLHVSARIQCTIVPGDAVSPTGLESCRHQIYCLRESLEQASCQTVQGDCGAIPSTPLPYRLPASFILKSKRGYRVTSHGGVPSQDWLSHHSDSRETIERTVQGFSF